MAKGDDRSRSAWLEFLALIGGAAVLIGGLIVYARWDQAVTKRASTSSSTAVRTTPAASYPASKTYVLDKTVQGEGFTLTWVSAERSRYSSNLDGLDVVIELRNTGSSAPITLDVVSDIVARTTDNRWFYAVRVYPVDSNYNHTSQRPVIYRDQIYRGTVRFNFTTTDELNYLSYLRYDTNVAILPLVKE